MSARVDRRIICCGRRFGRRVVHFAFWHRVLFSAKASIFTRGIRPLSLSLSTSLRPRFALRPRTHNQRKRMLAAAAGRARTVILTQTSPPPSLGARRQMQIRKREQWPCAAPRPDAAGRQHPCDPRALHTRK